MVWWPYMIDALSGGQNYVMQDALRGKIENGKYHSLKGWML
jgi:hypothetical protein